MYSLLTLVFIIIVASSTFSSDVVVASSSSFGPLTTVPSQLKGCTSLIVMMHGLGDRGEGWKGQFSSYQRSRPGVCVILPTAKNILVEFSGQKMNAWYGISRERYQNWRIDANLEEVNESAQYIMDLAKKYKKQFNIPWNKVLFAGFSQGASMALHIGSVVFDIEQQEQEQNFAGIVSVGGFLAAEAHVLEMGELGKVHENVPMLMINGKADRVVTLDRAVRAMQSLKKAGVKDVKMETDDNLAHSLNERMWNVMQRFMDEKLLSSNANNKKNSDL